LLCLCFGVQGPPLSAWLPLFRYRSLGRSLPRHAPLGRGQVSNGRECNQNMACKSNTHCSQQRHGFCSSFFFALGSGKLNNIMPANPTHHPKTRKCLTTTTIYDTKKTMAYSPPKYPAAIPDQVTDLPDRTDDIDWIEAWIYNYVKKELVAIMTELGTDPAGTEATVAARLTAIEASGVDESVILNIYLNSFRIAVLGSYAVMNMAKGISDEYEDETGIDTGTSTNEDYDSDLDLYKPSTSADTDILTGGTPSASDVTNGAAAQFIDGNLGTFWGSNITTGWWKYDLGAAVTKTAIKYRIYGATTYTYNPKNWTLQGSNNDSDWDTLDTQINQSWSTDEWKEYEFSNTTAYRYYQIVITENNGGAFVVAFELEIFETGLPDNMSLVSEAFTADSAPDDARIIIFEEDVDEITLNTDIKAYVSRDDGANFTQITLTDEGYFDGTKRILSGTVDISGQPSDTDMIYKIETLNNKDLKLYGSAMSWT